MAAVGRCVNGPRQRASGADDPAAPEAPATSENGTGTGGGTGSTSEGSDGDASPVTCTGENTKVVVSKVSRPINHLLLTVTNTGSRACAAYHAPLLRFDEEQSATQIIDASKPQSVVTLAPGRSAYASIMLSGAGAPESNGRTAQRLTVHFAPRSGTGSAEGPTQLKLPAGTYKDDNAAVTYWQSDMSEALTY